MNSFLLKIFFYVVFITVAFSSLYAIKGELDETFQGNANDYVQAIAVQKDGKIILGGDFTLYNGHSFSKIVRVDQNGVMDPSFKVGEGFKGEAIRVIVIQEDGKILVGGDFTSYQGKKVGNMIRLNPDGTIDNSFKIGKGFNKIVRTILLDKEKRILVGGSFTSYQDKKIRNLIRLNNDGSIDPSFKTGKGFDEEGQVYAIGIQEDGKIVVGGTFLRYNDEPVYRIIRLNPDGSRDQSFKVGRFSDFVTALVCQKDKIVVGGNFTFYNDERVNYLVRLHLDGTLDRSFQTNTFQDAVLYLLPYRENKIFVIDYPFFEGYNIQSSVTLIHSDGKRDNQFQSFFNNKRCFNNWLSAFALQDEDKLLVGGNFTLYKNIPVSRIIRLK